MANPFSLRSAWLAALALTTACAEDPWALPARAPESAGTEVFRVFCKRTAKESFPEDISGWAFESACLGKGPPPRSSERLDAILARREKVVDTIDRALGDNSVMQEPVVEVLANNEIRDFLSDLVPLYDKPSELLPTSSRVLAAVLQQLTDVDDAAGAAALDAFAKVAGRSGYRRADLALGLLRPVLEYPDLDGFAEQGLKAIARGGVAETSLDEMTLGLALEMAAYDPAPPAADSTLIVARDFMLSPIDQLDQPPREPVYITKRDARGVALPHGGSVVAPFVDADMDGLADVDALGRFVSNGPSFVPAPYTLAGESDTTMRDASGRALNPLDPSTPLFESFDAQPTMAAAFLREDARLSVPAVEGGRTTFEKLGRGLSVLFGLPSQRVVTYGKAPIAFTGPDPTTGAMHDLVHAVGGMVQANPDATRRMMDVLGEAMASHEHEMAAVVDMMLRINERGNAHDEAVLVGQDGPGTPHVFWDDLLAVGVRMTKRPGLIEAVLRMATQPESANMGPILATWMRYSDQAPYKNADFVPEGADETFTEAQEADLNAQAMVDYQTLVDRTQPDVGVNRSVWQQVLSMVHNLGGQGICNKEAAVLHLIRSNDSLAGVPNLIGLDLPLHGQGYTPCELFEVPELVQIWVRALFGEAEIALKPPDLELLNITGLVGTGTVQEKESQIHGFNRFPTPESFARFIYGPWNQFTRKIADPVLKHGIPVADIDPYALFTMEVPHPMPDGGSMNFAQAAVHLAEAFETHELKDDDGALTDGYVFNDLLNVMYEHWGSRTDAECTGLPACTQHLDPAAPFFGHQTDLRSYEPLLAEVFGEERLIAILGEAAKALATVTVDGKDGLAVLAEFLETLIKPSDTLTYRDGRATALTNVGEEVGYVSPMYLLLDGLKRIDTNFEAPENAAKHESWLEARSEIVDLFLTIEDVGGQKRLEDRVGRSIFIRTLEFLSARVDAHQQAGDLEAWTAGLGERSAVFFDTPLVAGLLHLFEQSWEEPAAGRELMRFLAYMVDEQRNPVGFETTLVAASDLFQLLEDSPSIAPIFDLLANALVKGTPAAVDGTGPAELAANDGALRTMVEFLNELLKVHTKRPSTFSRVARNLVRTTQPQEKSPLELLIDAVSEVERVEPKLPSDATLTRDDLERIAQQVHHFIADDGHGLERLYDVIQNRNLDSSSLPDSAAASLQKP